MHNFTEKDIACLEVVHFHSYFKFNSKSFKDRRHGNLSLRLIYFDLICDWKSVYSLSPNLDVNHT